MKDRHGCSECPATFELQQHDPHSAWLCHLRDWHRNSDAQEALWMYGAHTIRTGNYGCAATCSGRIGAERPIAVPESRPDIGLNPYFVHPDDLSGRPSGTHCRWPASAVECIQCTPSDLHVHGVTDLYRFDAESGEVKHERIRCRTKIINGYNAYHEWYGPGHSSNANIVYEWQQHDWTLDKAVALHQRVVWLEARVDALIERKNEIVAEYAAHVVKLHDAYDDEERHRYEILEWHNVTKTPESLTAP